MSREYHREPEPLVRGLDRLEPCPGHEVIREYHREPETSVVWTDWNLALTHEVSIENTIENLNHWSVGWTDWNLALDTLQISLELCIPE